MQCCHGIGIRIRISQCIVYRDLVGISLREQWTKLLEDDTFLDTVRILERLLGQPCHSKIQFAYKGKFKSDPLDLEAQFRYATHLLWTYSFDKVDNRAVSAISINRTFTDIVAVGYGKYFYKEPDKGHICIWNVKNPKHPERWYRLVQQFFNVPALTNFKAFL